MKRDIPEVTILNLGTPGHRARWQAFKVRTRPFTDAEREADRIEEMVALSELALSRKALL